MYMCIVQLLNVGVGCLKYYEEVVKVYVSDRVQKMERHNKVSEFSAPLTLVSFTELTAIVTCLSCSSTERC